PEGAAPWMPAIIIARLMTPFTVHVDDAILADLRRRLAATRWPDEVEGAGWAYGSNLAYMRELVDYWRDRFDWRAHEAGINRVPQFVADVGGHRIHFAYVRGKGARTLPLVLTHGWPSAGFEMWDLIGPLTDPGAHGGDPDDAFDVVVPSMPGFGFSSRPSKPGFVRVDNLWRSLMVEVLGYPRFLAHGVDVGARVTSALGRFHADAVMGIHIATIDLDWPDPLPDDLSQAERDYIARCEKWEREEGGYSA